MNKPYRTANYLVMALCLLLVLPACKLRKNRTNPVIGNVKTDENSFQKTVQSTVLNWTYFSTKADIAFHIGNNDNRVNANLRMYKDSLIWFSANMLGIEGVRGLVTKDSVWIINKLTKEYYVYGKDYLDKFIGGPVEIGELQNILINNPMYIVSLYKWLSKTETQFTVQAQKNDLQAEHTFSNGYSKIEQTRISQVTNNQKVTVSYSDFKELSGANFPRKIVLESTDFKEPFRLDIEYLSPDFTTVPSFPFTIPKSYARTK